MFSLGSRKTSRSLSSKCFNTEGSRPTQHEQRGKKKVQTLSSRVFVMPGNGGEYMKLYMKVTVGNILCFCKFFFGNNNCFLLSLYA